MVTRNVIPDRPKAPIGNPEDSPFTMESRSLANANVGNDARSAAVGLRRQHTHTGQVGALDGAQQLARLVRFATEADNQYTTRVGVGSQ